MTPVANIHNAEELKRLLPALQNRNAQIRLFGDPTTPTLSGIPVEATEIISCDIEEGIGYLKIKTEPGETSFSGWQEVQP